MPEDICASDGDASDALLGCVNCGETFAKSAPFPSDTNEDSCDRKALEGVDNGLGFDDLGGPICGECKVWHLEVSRKTGEVAPRYGVASDALPRSSAPGLGLDLADGGVARN